MSYRTNIVIPLRDPYTAKQRLAGVLSSHQRAELVQHLFQKNLDLLTRRFPQIHKLVVTDSQMISALAASQGASVLLEEQAKGLTEAVELATRWSLDKGFESQLVLPADLADLDCDELQYLLDYPRPDLSLLVCPAKDDGTNALMTTPPDVIPFWFGKNSAVEYLNRARSRNVHCERVVLQNMKFDVDTPEDLERFLQGARANPRRELTVDIKRLNRNVFDDQDVIFYEGALSSA